MAENANEPKVEGKVDYGENDIVARRIVKFGVAAGYKSLHPEANLKPKSLEILGRNLINSTPGLKKRINELLEEQGMGLTYTNKKLKSLVDAEKVIVVDKSTMEVQDNPTRMEAVKTLYKLHGVLKDTEVNVDNRQITFSGDANKLQMVADEIRKLNEQLALNDTEGEISNEV